MKLPGLNDIIETPRCILKIPTISEAEEMWNLISENITRFMIWSKSDNYNEMLENIKETILKAKESSTWDAAIYEKETWKLLWRCWINKINKEVPAFEIWYWVEEWSWGKWYMPECVKALAKFAFEAWNFEKWIIHCDSQNINSEKVALKSWFTFEWEFKNHERIKWQLRGTKFFWLTREDYYSNKL